MGTYIAPEIIEQSLLDRLLHSLDAGTVADVVIGLHWTAVVADVAGERRCGLASTVRAFHDDDQPDVLAAGHLQERDADELAALLCSQEPVLASVGLATINALLPPEPDHWVILNAEEVIARHGANKKVALIGHFPFIPRLRHRVGELSVLEHQPRPGGLPASAAPAVLAGADVVALTGMTIHNHTLPGLLRLCSRDALVILLGPSTPLSPVLYDYGVDILCGSVVTDVDAVLAVVRQGGTFRQLHRAGVRTVTMARPEIASGWLAAHER
jgi:uncharacterized protein